MLALIPLFPLLGFLINGCWYAFGQAPKGRTKAGATVTGTIATLAIGAVLRRFACDVSSASGDAGRRSSD